MLVNSQPAVPQGKAPCFAVFPWCEHARRGQFQAADVTSLRVRLGRDAHVWFSGSNELGPTGRSPSLGGRVDGQTEEQLGEGEAGDWMEGRG